MVAEPWLTILARQAPTKVVLIAHKVDLPIGACTSSTPYTHLHVVLYHHISVERSLLFRLADDFTKGPAALVMIARPLLPTNARDAPTHVALITDLIYFSIRAGTRPAPDTNWRAHLPVDYVVWYRLAGVISIPFKSVHHLVSMRAVGLWVDTLEKTPKHGVRKTELVVWHDVSVFLDIHSTLRTGAERVVQLILFARKVRFIR